MRVEPDRLQQVALGRLELAGGDGERSAVVTANVQKVLDNLVGPGNATVAATVQSTRSSSETVSEEFATPEGGVQALTEQTSTEDYTGAGVIFGVDRVASEPWKTSALRDATTALVREGLAMIAGGYRTLLRHRRRS